MAPAFDAVMRVPVRTEVRESARRPVLTERELREGFVWVVEEHYRQIYNLICRYTGDAEAAADLSQDVFVRAYQGLRSFRQDSSIYTWLYRIALNTSTNWLKRQRRRRERWGGSLDDAETLETLSLRGTLTSNSPTPLEWVELQERRKQVWQCLHRLSDGDRAIIIMHNIEDLSLKDIAQVLGISCAAVKSRLFRAREELRKLLERRLAS